MKRKSKRKFNYWVIINEIGRPDYSMMYKTKKEALFNKQEWCFTGCRPCKVEVTLPEKLPPAP